MATKLVKCDCKHEFQDSRYGKQNRVANYAPKQTGHRCTVCGTVHKNDGTKKK